MNLYNNWNNWILRSYNWKNYNLIIKPASDIPPTEKEVKKVLDSPELIKQKKIKEINLEFDSLINNALRDYSEVEIKTFTRQYSEAQKVASWEKSNFLEKLAKQRGEKLQVLADKIIFKTEALDSLITQWLWEKKEKINLL